MSERKLSESDLGALFHTVLFAYQKTLRQTFGDTPSLMLTKFTIPIIEKILDKASPELLKANDVDVALQEFADLIVASGFVRSAKITEDGEKRVLDLDECIFADHVHSMLNIDSDVTCPWAIIAISLARKFNSRDVKVALSKITSSGSKTSIEF